MDDNSERLLGCIDSNRMEQVQLITRIKEDVERLQLLKVEENKLQSMLIGDLNNKLRSISENLVKVPAESEQA